MLTKDEINMAGELTEKLQDQGELIAKVLCDMAGSEYFERVEFLPLPTGEKGISITIQNEGFGEWPKTRVEWFPEEYLSKSEAELVYELNRRHEEERRQKEAEERAEKEAEEREKEEAAKKRYQLFLEPKQEFGNIVQCPATKTMCKDLIDPEDESIDAEVARMLTKQNFDRVCAEVYSQCIANVTAATKNGLKTCYVYFTDKSRNGYSGVDYDIATAVREKLIEKGFEVFWVNRDMEIEGHFYISWVEDDDNEEKEND